MKTLNTNTLPVEENCLKLTMKYQTINILLMFFYVGIFVSNCISMHSITQFQSIIKQFCLEAFRFQLYSLFNICKYVFQVPKMYKKKVDNGSKIVIYIQSSLGLTKSQSSLPSVIRIVGFHARKGPMGVFCVPKSLVGGFGCDELVLYGIKDTGVATL